MKRLKNTYIDATQRGNRPQTNATILCNLEQAILDLYFDGRCGRAAAEYNLVKAGMIEVASGHVPGHLREAEPFWESSKWKVTKSGSGASIASLTGIILQDPPLEIALWDVADEARDVAGACGGCEPDDPFLLMHRRILAHLLDRVERIRVVKNI